MGSDGAYKILPAVFLRVFWLLVLNSVTSTPLLLRSSFVLYSQHFECEPLSPPERLYVPYEAV